MRKVGLILFIIISFSLLFAQQVYGSSNDTIPSGIDTLSRDIIKSFETVSEDIFYELENLNLIILDKEEDLEGRYDAKFLAKLFFNPEADIEDYLGSGNNYSEIYGKDKYFEKLFIVSNEKFELTKEFTFFDTEEFKPKWTAYNTENNDTFRVYLGALTYLDLTGVSVEVKEKGIAPETTSTEKREQYKRMIFEIRKTVIPDVRWKLFIKKIEVLDDKTIALKKAKKEGKRTLNTPTLDRLVNPKPLTQVMDEIRKDTLIATDTKDRLDSILVAAVERQKSGNKPEVSKRDMLAYKKLNIVDFLIPGKGHLKFNKNRKALVPTITYLSLGVATVGSSIYFKRKSNRFYTKHKESTTFRELDSNYLTANENNHKFLISLGCAGLVWGTNAVHLLFKNKKHRPTRRYAILPGASATGAAGLTFKAIF